MSSYYGKKASGQPQDMGWALPSWVPGQARASQNPYELIKASKLQIDLARQGEPLTDYRRAENNNLFFSAPINDETAYLKSAYWMAVAARLSGGSQALVNAAISNQRRGVALTSVPGSSYKRDQTVPIMRASARLIERHADASNPGIRAVMAMMGHMGTQGSVERSQQWAHEASPTGVVTGTVAASGRQVAEGTTDALQVIGGVFSGKKPAGMTPGKWFALKWALRAGLVVVVVGGVAVAFPAQSRAVARAAGPAARRARDVAAPIARRAGRAADQYGRRAYRAARRRISEESDRRRLRAELEGFVR